MNDTIQLRVEVRDRLTHHVTTYALLPATDRVWTLEKQLDAISMASGLVCRTVWRPVAADAAPTH